MKLRRKVAALVLIATMVVGCESGTRRASAQDAPTTPDLRMLMNLDLFEPRHNGAQGAASPAAAARPSAPADDSLFDQIRALDSMGYLGNQQGNGSGNGAPAPRAAAQAPQSAPPPESTDAPPPRSDVREPAEAPQPAPQSRPSYDVEGPQP
jgi:hypothetical protein